MSQRDTGAGETPPSWSTERMTEVGMDRTTRVARLGDALEARGRRLAVAESCTGGLLAATLTEQSGSSGWFEGGWVTYSNRAKQRDLNVPGALFSEVGAVSREVVTAMAVGAIRRADVSYSVAISGVAGPSGGSEAKPVGTVWIGWGYWSPAAADGGHREPLSTFAARFRFDGDRAAVRESAVDVALRGLCAHLSGETWDEAAAARWSKAFWPTAGLKM
ncbi:CinA family protein [Guyparkeria hydrothermalis]|uniref:CinA family protein n=1 Tax=Guyparkeria hydrothermalis TaxID=923 RepID=UPI0020221135|nr:CinA family protein [Guyparkeria hydrothermalis]MCL7743663.1 CinA family protein [Guyparkeria hydrothermalis]